MAERGSVMIGHTFVITIIMYFVLLHIAKVGQEKAEDNSILFGCIILAYMLIFGHASPSCKSINPSLMIPDFVCGK